MSALLRFDEPFDHDGFIFELKYDGFRALAHLLLAQVFQPEARNRDSIPQRGKATRTPQTAIRPRK